MSPQLTGLYPLSCSSQTISLLHLVELEWKEKDLKAKSGRTDHRLAGSPESFFSLSPSHSPQPLGFHAPLDSPTSASHLASPLRTGSASYLRARPAAMLALVAARQRTQAAEAVGSSAVQSAEAPRSSSAALYCACTAATLLNSTSHPPVPLAAAPAQAGAVRCRRCVGSVGRGGRGESREE